MPAGQIVDCDPLPDPLRDPDEPSAEDDPGGQKYPAAQSPVHVSTFNPLVLPYTPAGQGVHAFTFVPPTEYVPGGHGTPVTSPGVGQYIPAGHGDNTADEPFAPPVIGHTPPTGHCNGTLPLSRGQ